MPKYKPPDKSQTITDVLRGPRDEDLALPPGVKVAKLKKDEIATAYQGPGYLGKVFGREGDHQEVEKQLRFEYSKHYGDNIEIPAFSVQQVNEAFDGLLPKLATDSKTAKDTSPSRIHVVDGVDALELPAAKIAAGGIVQVASQFNALEATSPEKSPLSKYCSDYTQGPRCVMPCLHALIRRDLMDYNAFKDVIPDQDARDELIKDGYVQWGGKPEDFLKYIKNPKNVEKLLMLPMWAKPEFGEHPILQCFTAAPPTNAYGNGGDKKIQQEIARILMVEQYKMLAKMAVIRSRDKGQTVPLHLTMVGGGVFNNDPMVLIEALQAVKKIIKGEKIDLFMHAWNLKDKNTLIRLVGLYTDTVDEAKEFLQKMKAERINNISTKLTGTLNDAQLKTLQELMAKDLTDSEVINRLNLEDNPGTRAATVQAFRKDTTYEDMIRKLSGNAKPLTPTDFFNLESEFAAPKMAADKPPIPAAKPAAVVVTPKVEPLAQDEFIKKFTELVIKDYLTTFNSFGRYDRILMLEGLNKQSTAGHDVGPYVNLFLAEMQQNGLIPMDKPADLNSFKKNLAVALKTATSDVIKKITPNKQDKITIIKKKSDEFPLEVSFPTEEDYVNFLTAFKDYPSMFVGNKENLTIKIAKSKDENDVGWYVANPRDGVKGPQKYALAFRKDDNDAQQKFVRMLGLDASPDETDSDKPEFAGRGGIPYHEREAREADVTAPYKGADSGDNKIFFNPSKLPTTTSDASAEFSITGIINRPKQEKKLAAEEAHKPPEKKPAVATAETPIELMGSGPKTAVAQSFPQPAAPEPTEPITQKIVEALRKRSEIDGLNHIKTRYADLAFVNSQIAILEEPGRGTSPKLLGMLFKAFYSAMQKENIPPPPHIATLGFDANDSTSNNLDAFKVLLSGITRPYPKTLIVPLGAKAHMVGMRIRIVENGPPEILYFNSLGGGIYPGTEKFVAAVAEYATKNSLPNPIARIVPKKKLQRTDLDDYNCGHWVTWFYRLCATHGDKTSAQLEAAFDKIETPENLDFIRNVKDFNLAVLKKYRNDMQSIRKSEESSPAVTERRRAQENGAFIHEYIKTAVVVNGKLEITFKDDATSLQKRMTFYALQQELTKTTGRGPEIFVKPATSFEDIVITGCVIGADRNPENGKMNFFVKGQPSSKAYALRIFNIIGPKSIQELQAVKTGLVFSLNENEFYFSKEELKQAFSTFKKFFETSWENRPAANLSGCGGIKFDNIAQLSPQQLAALREAYREVFGVELLKTSGLELATPAVSAAAERKAHREPQATAQPRPVQQQPKPSMLGMYAHHKKATQTQFAEQHGKLLQLQAKTLDEKIQPAFDWLTEQVTTANKPETTAATAAEDLQAHPFNGVVMAEGSTKNNISLEVARSDGGSDKVTQTIDENNNLKAALHGKDPEDKAFVILALTNAHHQPLELQYNSNMTKVLKIMEACVMYDVKLNIGDKNRAHFKDPCPKQIQELFQLLDNNGAGFKEKMKTISPLDLEKRKFGDPFPEAPTSKLGIS